MGKLEHVGKGALKVRFAPANSNTIKRTTECGGKITTITQKRQVHQMKTLLLDYALLC